MIGTQIQKLRQERNLTLTQLAEKTEISKSYLSYIERNIQTNPSIEVLGKIAKALEVDVQNLLSKKKPSPDIKPKKIHVMDWSDLINTALESGIINQTDLQEIRLALQKDNSKK